MSRNSTLLDRIVGNTCIRLLPVGKSLPVVDAIVVEQDTNLMLDTHAPVRKTRASYPVLIKKIQQQKSHTPGQVIVQGKEPMRLITIIYDIDKNPICQEDWVVTAMKNILETCINHKINTLAMALPGTSYGKIDKIQAQDWILQELVNRHGEYPGIIWLLLP